MVLYLILVIDYSYVTLEELILLYLAVCSPAKTSDTYCKYLFCTSIMGKKGGSAPSTSSSRGKPRARGKSSRGRGKYPSVAVNDGRRPDSAVDEPEDGLQDDDEDDESGTS